MDALQQQQRESILAQIFEVDFSLRSLYGPDRD
jgi:hypothetical protein